MTRESIKGYSGFEKRRYPRLYRDLKACGAIEPILASTAVITVEGTIKNISEIGALFETTRSAAVGQKVTITVGIDDWEELCVDRSPDGKNEHMQLAFRATVVRCHKVGLAEKYHIGVVFNEISEVIKIALLQYLKKHLGGQMNVYLY